MESSPVGTDLSVTQGDRQRLYDVGLLLGFEMRKADAVIGSRPVLASVQDLSVPAPELALNSGRLAPATVEARFRSGPPVRGYVHTYDLNYDADVDLSDRETIIKFSRAKQFWIKLIYGENIKII